MMAITTFGDSALNSPVRVLCTVTVISKTRLWILLGERNLVLEAKMNVLAMRLMRLVILLLLGGLYNEATQAEEQKCSAPQLYANLMKSDSNWMAEADPLPPKGRIEVGSIVFQPIPRLRIRGGAIWVAPFYADFDQARIRVVGNEVSLDRIRFMRPLGPEMWEALMVQKYAQPQVRFNLSAPDGECGAGALVLTIDGKAAAAPPFPIERWQFKRK
jgi:hypothetical protein